MKPLIYFFWYFLITINMMAMEPSKSRFVKYPVIIDCGCNYFVCELLLNAVVCETRHFSSQTMGKYALIHIPHSTIKGYIIKQGCVHSSKVADEYAITTKWKSTNFIFNIWKEPLFYGKAPPGNRYTEVTFSGLKAGIGSVWRISIDHNNYKVIMRKKP